MGRPPRFSAEAILDAALDVLPDGGLDALTIGRIAGRLGAPTGSIYHRFPSKSVLIAHLWLRTVLRFQEGFLDALDHPDVDEAVGRVVRHMLTWSRECPGEGRLVAEHWNRQGDEDWPEELAVRMSTVDGRVAAALADHCERRYGAATPDRLYAARFALMHLPYAAVHVHLLEGTPQPPVLEHITTEASLHALAAAG
ncbi:TetR/AcrR family transcriptional regulator [Prauserella muralis]|uniref:Uncharacterized protein n=1 Tax=Prauserella muralis TaxID=588067 RepID=A0A2V4B2H9_9PSEU|nr:TetR/AcrR family transcriptional regulator [Prauserella muralis]PXY28237.1 hypothetical protein BAY60_18110 [Prauserella muralis]TWE27403.1 TetR family transcriptional regulator [Prauserella muralis]